MVGSGNLWLFENPRILHDCHDTRQDCRDRFGGQYAHLIATKVPGGGVLAEIRQPDDPAKAFHGYQGIMDGAEE